MVILKSLIYFSVFVCIVFLDSCTNDLPKKNPLFSSTDTNIRKYIYEHQEDPQVKELLNISRENIRNLPDIVDFGILEINEEKKYTFYDVFIETGSFTLALYMYETQDSISIAPPTNQTGYINSHIELSWVEKDKNGLDKDHSKQIEIKAIVVEKKTIKDEDNPIIEIWKDKNIKKIYRN